MIIGGRGARPWPDEGLRRGGTGLVELGAHGTKRPRGALLWTGMRGDAGDAGGAEHGWEAGNGSHSLTGNGRAGHDDWIAALAGVLTGKGRCRNVEMPGARASAEREKIRGRKRLHRRSPGQGGLRRGARGLRGHSALGAQVAEWHKRRAPGRRARRRGRGGRNAHPQHAGRTQKVGSGES